MKSSNINTVIESFNSLLPEEKELAVDIINKAYAEESRKSILQRSPKAGENLKKGKVKKGSLKDLYKDLEND